MNMIRRRANFIMQGLRSALALALPWYIDLIAMIVRQIEHGSGMGCVKDSLQDTA